MTEAREIPLRAKDGTVRAVVLVDADLFDELNARRWSLDTDGYAARTFWRNGRQPRVRMHREVMRMTGTDPTGKIVDHINGNTLDNRRANLRIATPSQSCANVRRSKANTSGFKGVHWNRQVGKWAARIKFHRKTIHIGNFTTAEEAHAAYIAKARSLFGDFARGA